MEMTLSRRNFVRSGALAAAAYATSSALPAAAQPPESDKTSPVRLGLCSYTFRNFDRAQLIGYMKQLNVYALNAKDVKDHLPMDPVAEAKALDDYHAAGIQLHAAGAIYFPKNEDDDIRSKFEYCKRAGIKDRLRASLAADRLHGMSRIAEQGDAAERPGRNRVAIDKRKLVDVIRLLAASRALDDGGNQCHREPSAVGGTKPIRRRGGSV